MFKTYYCGSYENYETDITPLIILLDQHGTDLVGVEIGVSRGDSINTVTENCPNVSKIYGVDPYLPWKDVEGRMIDGLELDMIKTEAYLQHKYSPVKEKIEILEMKSSEAVLRFDDESLDFIFIDGDHTYESVLEDLTLWYPKIKNGGLLMGHDFASSPVSNAVTHFRHTNNITSYMSVYISCYAWKK